MRFISVFIFFLTGVLFIKCTPSAETYKFAGSFEEPQNELSRVISATLTTHLKDSIYVMPGVLGSAGLDSLARGSLDFAIADNFSQLGDNISSIIPLYSQILHVLHKRDLNYNSIEELLLNKKVYAGSKGSGTYRFVRNLMRHYGISARRVTFLSDLELFEADVIFSFTDLLSNDELRDLSAYQLFSFDDVDQYGKGSLAEGICTIYPQFEPYIISRDVYGDYTETPILTLKVEAIMVGRADLPNELVYNVVKALDEHKQEINKINPLLYDFSGSFEAADLNFKLHEGARNYLNRYEPTFLERYAEVFSVIISIFVALASTIFTVTSWQRTKKKNKIDVYYQKMVAIRSGIDQISSKNAGQKLITQIKSIQEETIELVVKEKLLADETFTIFLNLSKMVTEEIEQKIDKLS